MDTPVIFLIFNRPDLTRQVFEKIREVRPRHLFVVADGPRKGQPADKSRCAESRAIIDGVDWACEIHREFSDTNLGCKRRVASGITSAFEFYEEAIVLEDDCLPVASFFDYCTTLLERYRNNQQVMCISGDNFQQGITRGDGNYYYSVFPHCWGWATWKRAWDLYDLDLTDWPRWRDAGGLETIWNDPDICRLWADIFERSYWDSIDSWDYQWTLCCWMNGGLTALPNRNLVKNIGFGEEGTHTTTLQTMTIEAHELSEFRPPSVIAADYEADWFTLRTRFFPESGENERSRSLLRNIIRSTDVLPGIRRAKNYLNKTLRPNAHQQELNRLQELPRYTPGESNLTGVTTYFTDAPSFLSAYKSIFEKEVYRFHGRHSGTPIIIDGGANIGLAILYFKRLYPMARVIAFEADPKIFEFLEKNLRSWGLENVELYNVALWTEHGQVTFESEGADAGHISENSTGGVVVPTVPLAEFLDQRIEFLKLDVEGAETAIIESCREQLPQVRNLFVEYHSFAGQPQTLATLLEVLNEAGFRIVAQTEFAPTQPFVEPPKSKGIEFALNIFARKSPPAGKSSREQTT